MALYYTYSAMEEEIEKNKDHPQFAPLYFPNELHRHEALARDLEYFYGEDWQDQISCSPATQRYVERIHEIGSEDPALLVAHAYTRYMGDLSGGQVLKKVAQRALKLPPTGEGVFFYQFDSIHSNKAFKQLYRSRMNELELDTITKDRIVQEAVRAFQFNMEVRCSKVAANVRIVRIHVWLAFGPKHQLFSVIFIMISVAENFSTIYLIIYFSPSISTSMRMKTF